PRLHPAAHHGKRQPMAQRKDTREEVDPKQGSGCRPVARAHILTVPPHARPPHRLLHPVRVAQVPDLGRRVLALSEWKITPATVPPRVATAIRSAAQPRDARRCSAMAQPITQRENTSSTVARYSQSSP